MVEHASFGRTGNMRHTFHLAEGDTDRAAVHEVWERNGYRIERAHLRNRVVIDIGANVGAFTVLASKLGAHKVHAYEPHPETFEALEANTSFLDGLVLINRFAVVEAGQGGDALVLWRHGGAAGTGRRDDNLDHRGHKIEGAHVVPAIDVNEVWHRATEDGTRRVGFVKLDCEGCEAGLISTLDESYLSLTDRIVMEFHGPAMPHLAYLQTEEVLPPIVMALTPYGHVEINGRPSHGGYLWWRRYGL